MRVLRRIAVLGLLLAGAAHAAGVGARADDFMLYDRGGKLVRLSAMRGRVILVDFWASWCEPCKRELPLLAVMADRLRSRGVDVLAINIDRDRAKAESFLRSRAVSSLTVLYNPDLSVADRYRPPTIPSSFVVDRRGRIRFVNRGFEAGDERKIEQQLLGLVGEP